MRAASFVILAVLPTLAASLVLKETPDTLVLKEALESHPVQVDVGAIKARGTRQGGGGFPPATPGTYKLSETAAAHGLEESNALLDGGAKEWPLFAPGKAPLEQQGDAGPQFIMTNDATDFCSSGDRSGFSVLNVTDPTVVPFIVPQDQPGRRDAAVLIAPGGGNRFLSWSKEGTAAAKWLNSIGISAFVLKYRVPANTVETKQKVIIDSQRALSVVRHHAHEHGLNASRIGMMGFSAGGILTADVSLQKQRLYAPVDEIDQLSCKPDFVLVVYGAGKAAEVTKATPPTFIATARNDPCVSVAWAVQYYEGLLEHDGGDLHELHVFSDGHHGYGDCTLFVHGNEWAPVCAWTANAQGFIESLIGVKRPMEKHAMTLPPISA